MANVIWKYLFNLQFTLQTQILLINLICHRTLELVCSCKYFSIANCLLQFYLLENCMKLVQIHLRSCTMAYGSIGYSWWSLILDRIEWSTGYIKYSFHGKHRYINSKLTNLHLISNEDLRKDTGNTLFSLIRSFQFINWSTFTVALYLIFLILNLWRKLQIGIYFNVLQQHN